MLAGHRRHLGQRPAGGLPHEGGYRLWKTNYIAYDMVNHTYKYTDLYKPEDVESFTEYTEHQLDKVEKKLSRDELRDIFLRIYANPVFSKEKLAVGEPLR